MFRIISSCVGLGGFKNTVEMPQVQFSTFGLDILVIVHDKFQQILAQTTIPVAVLRHPDGSNGAWFVEGCGHTRFRRRSRVR